MNQSPLVAQCYSGLEEKGQIWGTLIFSWLFSSLFKNTKFSSSNITRHTRHKLLGDLDLWLNISLFFMFFIYLVGKEHPSRKNRNKVKYLAYRKLSYVKTFCFHCNNLSNKLTWNDFVSEWLQDNRLESWSS